MKAHGLGFGGGRWASAALLLVWSLSAGAAEEVQAGGDSAAAPEPSEPTLEWNGRVFARAKADERHAFERRLSIPSARLGLKATMSFFQAVIEADVAEEKPLKDAFLKVRSANNVVRGTAGQFKAPFLERQVESSWSLPTVGRGVVADYLVDRNHLGGRRLGATGELKFKKWRGLTATAGFFDGARDELGQRTGEDAAARVSFKPFRELELGTSTYLGEVFNGTRRFGASGDAKLARGPLTVWAEGVGGRIATGTFAAGLGMVSLTLPLDGAGKWELEPVVGAELLVLRGPTSGRGYGATLGTNLIYDQTFKVQVQLERALRPGDPKPGNELAVQLAARF